MLKLHNALVGSAESGIYRFHSYAPPQHIRQTVERLGWRYFYLDGRQIIDQTSFLRTCTSAMDLPDFFGTNWDDFAALLTDMEWAPALGYVILYDVTSHFAEIYPDQWELVLAIFQAAVQEWCVAGKPFYVLLRDADTVATSLPVL
jgi:hypothetical protein